MGRDITVSLLPLESLPDAYGQFDFAGHIQVRNDMDAFDTKDTVLHEVFHAIRWGQGRLYGAKVEEDYIRSLATGLIGVLQDNPEFAKWLLSPIKQPKPK